MRTRSAILLLAVLGLIAWFILAPAPPGTGKDDVQRAAPNPRTVEGTEIDRSGSGGSETDATDPGDTRRAAGPAIVAGTVWIDDDGTPAAGARVTGGGRSLGTYVTETDADGLALRILAVPPDTLVRMSALPGDERADLAGTPFDTMTTTRAGGPPPRVPLLRRDLLTVRDG